MATDSKTQIFSETDHSGLSNLFNNLLSIEVAFTIFLFAGVYKTAGFLNWFPVDLTAFFALITSVGLIWYLHGLDYKIRLESIIISSLFLSLVIYAIFSGIWSPSSDYYASKSFRLLFITGLALIVPAVVISSSPERLWRTGSVTVILAIPVASETIRLGLANGFATAPSPLNSGYLIAGRLLGFGILILAYYVLFIQPSKLKSALSLCLGGLFFLSLLILGARGPLIATICSFVLLVVFLYAYDVVKLTKRLAVGYLVTVPFLAGFLTTVVDPFRATRRIELLLQGGGNSLQTRLDMYIWSLQNIDFPSIFIGNGLGSFAVLYFSRDKQLYPHNIILEILFELGIVGLVLFLLLIGYSLYGSLPRELNKRNSLSILIMILLVYMFLNAGVTGDINENRYLFAVIGLLAYQFNNPHMT